MFMILRIRPATIFGSTNIKTEKTTFYLDFPSRQYFNVSFIFQFLPASAWSLSKCEVRLRLELFDFLNFCFDFIIQRCLRKDFSERAESLKMVCKRYERIYRFR